MYELVPLAAQQLCSLFSFELTGVHWHAVVALVQGAVEMFIPYSC